MRQAAHRFPTASTPQTSVCFNGGANPTRSPGYITGECGREANLLRHASGLDGEPSDCCFFFAWG